MSPVEQLIDEVLPVVRDSGAIAAELFRGAVDVREKSVGDWVTQADLAVEKHFQNYFSKQFPDHGVLSEESAQLNPDAEWTWILDPIDGTNYFARGIPLYSISLGLRHRNELVGGIVYDPQTEDLFVASRGNGATLNGKPIHCSTKTLEESVLCVEIPNRHLSIDETLAALKKVGVMSAHADRVRIFGVAALGLCYCATGGFDGYVNLSRVSKIWDLAAGMVILREAGGVVTELPSGAIIGGSQELHDQLIALIESPE